MHFNSQPHEEADREVSDSSFLRYISTHSLTRRLTFFQTIICMMNMYFNSQPHEEADIERWIEDGRKQYFNSQPHEEADWNQQVCIRIFGISTHSLTRRLTDRSADPHNVQCNFNSQPHEEADTSETL